MDRQPERQARLAQFLETQGWGGAKRHSLAGDASTRRYTRLIKPGGERAMLMDQPRGAETAACPPEASEEERTRLGYNAIARLAGPDTRPFAAVGNFLTQGGFSSPALIGQDYEAGFLLIEDLGEGLFADLIKGGEAEEPLYEAAIDALAALHRQAAPNRMPVPAAGDWPLLRYDALAMMAEADLLPAWFCKLDPSEVLADDQWAEYRHLWQALLKRIDLSRPVLTLRDYHAENLMWLPGRAGVARVGMLDFQDALAGAPAYDVVSLLEDARREVAPSLAARMMARYEAAAAGHTAFDAERFRFEAAILAAQRNAKIIGIFARLWLRDKKPRYLGYLPRMWAYMARDLAHPELRSLKAWFDRAIPQEMRARDWVRRIQGQ